MRVKDFEMDWNSGTAFNCCDDHITNCDDECKLGDVITCDECGIDFILEERNGVVMWRVND